MYSTAVCPYCVRAEQLLRARGVADIGKIRIDLEPARRAEMMQKTGRRTVPQIYIGERPRRRLRRSRGARSRRQARAYAGCGAGRRRGTLTQRDGSSVSQSRALLDRAAGLEQGGDPAAARALYDQVLTLVPDDHDALFGSGRLSAQQGDVVRAAQCFRTLLARDPDNLAARIHLASALVQSGDADLASAELAPAVAKLPQSPIVRQLAAAIAMRQGDVAAAKTHCRAGLAATPSHAGLLSVLAAALRAGGAYQEAVEALLAATRAEPGNAGAWLELGNTCMEAEVAKVGLTRTGAAAQPSAPSAAEAIDLAIDAFGHAVALQPSAAAPRAHLAMAARYACDWPVVQTAEHALKQMCAADAARCAFSPMIAVALLDDAATQREVIRAWSNATLPRTHAPAHLRQRGNRLRVGYLSSDFHDHATAHLMAGLFEQHDRARVETFAYASDGDDGSAMRRRLRAAFGNWRDVRALDDRRAAQLIEADALDVLVDLKGHTDGNRLAVLAHRPAPVQLHYLGFPGTLAFDAIDGFIADEIASPPDSDAEFSETLMRLPVCYQVNDQRRALLPVSARSAVGLADDTLVLACFAQTYKLSAPFVSAWMKALREHPRAVLWLYVPHARARHHLRAFAERAGIDSSRVVFAPAVSQAEHMARLRCADLALDILPYGSHTTGSDALWAGVPLLTCRGRTFAGRVGASLCHSTGLGGLVTESLDDYSRMLQRLCSDRSLLAHYRDHLESGRERLPLFDTASFTGEFERLLERAASGDRG